MELNELLKIIESQASWICIEEARFPGEQSQPFKRAMIIRELLHSYGVPSIYKSNDELAKPIDFKQIPFETMDLSFNVYDTVIKPLREKTDVS